MIYLDIHWLQISFQGRFWFDFCPFSVDLSMSKIKITFQEKNLPLHVFIFESWWICPGISALFPGISAQKNRHIFTQSRVISAQKVRNPKLATVVKKWPFPAPLQEIRPKGRNLANGQSFVSFRRSRYIYICVCVMSCHVMSCVVRYASFPRLPAESVLHRSKGRERKRWVCKIPWAQLIIIDSISLQTNTVKVLSK